MGDKKMKNYFFFLGGMDLEMSEIRKVLDKNNIPYEDAGLKWDTAKASAYGSRIGEVSQQGYIPVLVELDVNGSQLPENVIVVDHHGDRSDEDSSILQVCELLNVEPTRWQQFVGVNDVNFSHGMLAFGASKNEIAEVRTADRKMQGVTSEQERQAEGDYENLVVKNINGISVGIADNLSHDRFAPIQDLIFVNGDCDLLICIYRGENSTEINFYWYPELCKLLGEKYQYPTSYYGYQYWGSDKLNPNEVMDFILDWLQKNGSLQGVSQPSPRTEQIGS